MALTLTYNGANITSIPGSPAASDILKIGNGTQRLTLTYGVHNATLGWEFDQLEYSSNSGSTWTLVAYARDTFRTTLGGTDYPVWGATLTMPTFSGSVITLQMDVDTTIGGNSGHHRATITARTANAAIEINHSLAMNVTVALAQNAYLTNSGPCYWSAGAGENALALYNMVGSPFANPRVLALLYSGQLRTTNKQTTRIGNVAARAYVAGMAMYMANGFLLSAFQSPGATQTFLRNATASSILGGNLEWLWMFRATNFSSLKNIDLTWRNQHDNSASAFRPGCSWGSNAQGITVPIAASQSDAATTLQCTYSLAIDVPAQSGGSKLPIPVYSFPQALNRWIDACYARPAIGDGTNTQNGLWYQTPAALQALISPYLQSTNTTHFDANYGYSELFSNDTYTYNYSNALALQLITRMLQTGVSWYGSTDATTMADKLATIILNYQNVTGASVHYGAIYKVRNLAPTNTFTCQDTTHAANADQPHVSSYTMAEAVYALIGYYLTRGNQSLTTLNGTTTVAAAIDLACTYWSTVLNVEGGWLVEYNNTNVYTTTNARIGAHYPGSVTVEIAASMLHWSLISPTATTTQKALWKQQALRASEYWMTSESAGHACYEHGEDYVNHSSHASKTLMRGFARLYQLTGSARYQEWMAYYAEHAILLCKRVDEVINNSASNNQPLHTGAMISTIDWSGVESGEWANGWHLMASDVLALHPNPQVPLYFYIYANLAQNLWAFRDNVTFSSGSATSWCFASPNTSASGFGNNYFDNTRFSYLTIGGALLLYAYDSLARGDNALVGVFAANANTMVVPLATTIVLHNPQTTTQTVNVLVRGMANHQAQQDGVTISASNSGSDLQLATITLSSGQVSKVVVR